MIDLFPECQSYMTKALYPNRSSWAKSYLPFQFNGGIQSTQSVESFNAIIKKAVNSTSTLCDVEKAIDKRHESESKYCQLIDLKARQTTVGIPHLSSQFFSNIDVILIHFLTPLVLSWQRFQISQSFTYEGQLVTSFIEDLESNTTSTDFVENLVDEPQVTLQSLLSGIELGNIIETWRIRRIGGLSQRENLVALLSDGTHLCTCMETVTKGIICRHFWRVMLYSSSAKFHISMIPARWYKDNITNLDCSFENSPVLSAIEPVDTSTSSVPPPQNNFTLQSLRYFQGVEHIQPNEIMRQNNSKRNRFGVAFSTAKTAINVALETKTDEELIKILKDFIAAKHEIQSERNDHTNNNLEVNNYTEDQSRQDTSNIIIPLQQHLIGQITNPNVTKIRGAPSKKRLKSAMELSKKRVPMQETLNDLNYQVAKSQHKCLLCGKPGHYQKKCPNARDRKYRDFCKNIIKKYKIYKKLHLQYYTNFYKIVLKKVVIC
ncbi:hypothetical protein RhiirB3_467899 [Rhizophagus irregularis]|nr:hypothetical protein RhiirB3_467899 [Rhizophagus irregularis]